MSLCKPIVYLSTLTTTFEKDLWEKKEENEVTINKSYTMLICVIFVHWTIGFDES